MFFHNNHPHPKYPAITWAYLALLILFTLISLTYVPLGFAGLGALLIIGGIYAEMNAASVWALATDKHGKVLKAYAKQPWYRRPSPVYYGLNVYVLFPLVILMGMILLTVVYQYA